MKLHVIAMIKALSWPCMLVSVLVGLRLPLQAGQASVAAAPQASAPEARAQDASPPNDRPATQAALDYGLGLGTLQLRDDLLRPLRWTGGQGALVVGLEVDTGRLLHRAGIEVTQSVHYACLLRLRAGRRVQVLVGATYRYESIDAYYYDWDDSFLYWMTSHSLAPTVALEMHPWQGRTLRVSFELPALALLSRPASERIYKVDPMPYVYRWPALTHQNLRWVGPTDLFAPTLTATYDRQVGRHFGMRLGFDLYFRRTNEPRPFYALGETVRLEFRHVF
jgi:hypothetical protein